MGGEILRNCPFCGGSSKAHVWEMQNDARFAGVECVDCGAEIALPVVWMDDGSAELPKAIAAWNRRSPDPELVEALTEARQYVEQIVTDQFQDIDGSHDFLPRLDTLLSRIREVATDNG